MNILDFKKMNILFWIEFSIESFFGPYQWKNEFSKRIANDFAGSLEVRENGYEGYKCDIYSGEKMRHRCCMNFDDLVYNANIQHPVLWPMHLRYFESASCVLSNILDRPLINRKTSIEGKYLLIPKCVVDNRQWTRCHCRKSKLQWIPDMIAVNT